MLRFDRVPKTTVVNALACGTALVMLTSSALAQRPSTAADSVTRIAVEPDYLVSRDGDVPHVEIMAAANPRDRRNLIAGAITYTRPEGGTATKVYASLDGGISWSDVSFAEQLRWGGADPQVAFSAAGTAIFATLASAPDESGRTRAFLHAYRSEDGGRTWSRPIDLGASYDHPMLVADQSTGRFAGRLYMAVLYGREYSLGVFRSEDDGRSWIGPVKFLDGEGKRGLNVDPMLILSDGTVVVTLGDFPSNPAQDSTWTDSRLYTVISTDGGVTFSAPRPGPVTYPRGSRRHPDSRLGSWRDFAADVSPRFRDRIYAVWSDFATPNARAVIAWSNDRGASWSTPRPIDRSAPAGAKQFQVSVAVNKDGIVGVTWFDTRETTGPLAFRQYFAASLDGGETFTAPVAVSSAESRPLAGANLTLTPLTFTGLAGELRVAFVSPASRWVSGGDYLGLTSDVAGDFHAVWADARAGTYQVYTARVRVVRELPNTTAAAPVAAPPADVTRDIELVSELARYDTASRELHVWVRLKNSSARRIAGPIALEVRKFGSGMGDADADMAPEILSATNGKTGAGAVIRYDDALGSRRALEPQAVSGAMLWRLRLKDPQRVPNLHVFITSGGSG